MRLIYLLKGLYYKLTNKQSFISIFSGYISDGSDGQIFVQWEDDHENLVNMTADFHGVQSWETVGNGVVFLFDCTFTNCAPIDNPRIFAFKSGKIKT